MDNNELKHYGVLGMKWGVRRYQNKDGSLTSAGKKRRNSSDVNNGKKAFNDKMSFREKRRLKKAQKEFDKNLPKRLQEAETKANEEFYNFLQPKLEAKYDKKYKNDKNWRDKDSKVEKFLLEGMDLMIATQDKYYDNVMNERPGGPTTITNNKKKNKSSSAGKYYTIVG